MSSRAARARSTSVRSSIVAPPAPSRRAHDSDPATQPDPRKPTRPPALPRSAFILSPTLDALFVIGTPLLCLLLFPLARLSSPVTVWAAVMSFGAVGHHLPGFLRTYGDRDLFRRHRARFVGAPPVVFGLALLLSFRDLHALALVQLAWALWHGMMQHYGFMRIYDAKVGRGERWVSRLDLALSVSWFFAAVALSPYEAGSVLEALDDCGLPLVPRGAFAIVRVVALAGVSITTLAWLSAAVVTWRRGRPMSPLKLALAAGTFSFVWFARVITRDPFLGAALFEVLHDVQYLAIVWAFNRARVEARIDRGALGSSLFGSPARLLAYVAVCLAYGGIGFVTAGHLTDSPFRRVLLSLLATSALLHFYFDGFIWKVRRPDTRVGLRLAVDSDPPSPSPTRPARLAHLVAFAVPVFGLAGIELARSGRDRLEAARVISAAAPESGWQKERLGSALLDRGELVPSLVAIREAVKLAPDLASAHARLSSALLQSGDRATARDAARRALALDDRIAEAHLTLADTLAADGLTDEAAVHYQAVIDLGGDLGSDLNGSRTSARLHNNFGNVLLALKRYPSALLHFREAQKRAPESAETRLGAGLALDGMGQESEAAGEFKEALRLDPAWVAAEADLGGVLARMGRRDEAILHLQRALALDPRFAPATQSLQALGVLP